MIDDATAAALLDGWVSWWSTSDRPPVPDALPARTMLFLLDGRRRGGDPGDLLREWHAWWATSDKAPAEMPGALQVRTRAHCLARTVGELGAALCVTCLRACTDHTMPPGEWVCARCAKSFPHIFPTRIVVRPNAASR